MCIFLIDFVVIRGGLFPSDEIIIYYPDVLFICWFCPFLVTARTSRERSYRLTVMLIFLEKTLVQASSDILRFVDDLCDLKRWEVS